MLVRVIKIYRSLFHRAEEERDSTMSVLDPLLSTCFLPQSHFLFLLSFQISLFLPPVPILSRQHSKINKEIFLIYLLKFSFFISPIFPLHRQWLSFPHLCPRNRSVESFIPRFFSNRIPQILEGQENSQK